MPQKRLSMRQVYEVLRLKWAQGLSDRQVAQSLGLSHLTVAHYVQRAQAAQMPQDIEQAVIHWRHMLAQAGQPHGAAAIQQVLRQHGLEPVPAARTLYRILQRHNQKESLTP